MITKRISISLTVEEWARLEACAEKLGGRSVFLSRWLQIVMKRIVLSGCDALLDSKVRSYPVKFIAVPIQLHLGPSPETTAVDAGDFFLRHFKPRP